MKISGKKVIYVDFEIEVSQELLNKHNLIEEGDYSTHDFYQFIEESGEYLELGEKWVEFEIDMIEGRDDE